MNRVLWGDVWASYDKNIVWFLMNFITNERSKSWYCFTAKVLNTLLIVSDFENFPKIFVLVLKCEHIFVMRFLNLKFWFGLFEFVVDFSVDYYIESFEIAIEKVIQKFENWTPPIDFVYWIVEYKNRTKNWNEETNYPSVVQFNKCCLLLFWNCCLK